MIELLDEAQRGAGRVLVHQQLDGRQRLSPRPRLEGGALHPLVEVAWARLPRGEVRLDAQQDAPLAAPLAAKLGPIRLEE